MAKQHLDTQTPGQRSAPYPGPFLFVNKNAENLRKLEEQQFEIRRHVMRVGRRSRKPASHSQAKSLERQTLGSMPLHMECPGPANSTAPTALKPPVEPVHWIEQLLLRAVQYISRYQEAQSQARQESGLRNRRMQSSLQEELPPPTLSPGPSAISAVSATGILSPQQAHSILQYVLAPRPAVNIGSGNSDPFDAAALPLDAFFNSLVQTWKVGFMANFWPPCVYLDPSNSASCLVDDWIRSSVIGNEAMLHGIFAATLSFTANFLPQTATTPILWERAMHHHVKCLESTRSQLKNTGTVREVALNMIHQSSTFSYHCQDLKTCEVHKVITTQIINSLAEGLNSMHPILRDLLILCDTLVASCKPRRPSFRAILWAPKAWGEEDSLRQFDDLFYFRPESFREYDIAAFLLSRESDRGAVDGSIPCRLLEIINLHREALVASALASELSKDRPQSISATSNSRLGRADPIYNWLCLRQYALTSLTTELYMDMLDIEQHQGPSQIIPWSESPQTHLIFHSCILLAVNCTFQFIVRYENAVPSMAYIPIHHLRSRLDLLMTRMRETHDKDPIHHLSAGKGVADRSNGQIAANALLFMFFAGALVEESDASNRSQLPGSSQNVAVASTRPNRFLEVPGDLITKRWFSAHFCTMLHHLGLKRWVDAKSVLVNFVYNDRVLDPFLQLLAVKRTVFASMLSFDESAEFCIGHASGR